MNIEIIGPDKETTDAVAAKLDRMRHEPMIKLIADSVEEIRACDIERLHDYWRNEWPDLKKWLLSTGKLSERAETLILKY